MENNAPLPPKPEDTWTETEGVWISKEEYERLSKTAGVGASVNTPLAPDEIKKISTRNFIQAVAGTALAIVLYLGFTSSFGLGFSPIIIILFLLLGGLSVYDAYKKRHAGVSINSSKKSPMKTILIVLAVLMAIPIAGPALFLLYMVTAIGLGGGKGS